MQQHMMWILMAMVAVTTAWATGDAHADEARAVTCSTAAKDLSLSQGDEVLLTCPAGCSSMGGSVWGTDLYTDDSMVCKAAIHAGVITDAGGTFELDAEGGQTSYAASTRNGVSTDSWGAWERSFELEAVDGATATLACSTSAKSLPGDPGARVTVLCPAGCAASDGTVWGSDAYTDDSAVCVAALHAGKLTPGSGATLEVKIGGAHPSYKGTTRNGVTTSDWGAWGRSFTFPD